MKTILLFTALLSTALCSDRNVSARPGDEEPTAGTGTGTTVMRSTPQLPSGASVAYADGWMAQFIDAWTIHEYHRAADQLPDDDDPVALEKLWSDIKKDAERLEAQWAALTDEQKIANTSIPFWKRDVGLPRRLSHSQTKKFVEALKK